MGIFEELKERGLIAQMTDEAEVRDLINRGGARFYIGYDPTADSLHIGHFMTLCLMKRLQMAGNKPIVVFGGGTGLIGDPSGKTDMRKMLTKEEIAHNIECFKKQIGRFIKFEENGEDPSAAIAVNNADWLCELKYVELLREIGPHFSVNNMLRAECYKQRMERGLTFLEFNYMIMQAYDFYELHNRYGCNMQFGGDDQWSNMLAGTELIRRKTGDDAYSMTIPLLLNSEGKKMGKTVSGAVWLDPEKTSPFDFFQYWRNVDDADVMKCIRMLTFLPLETIREIDAWPMERINDKKTVLAYKLTELVHGSEKAKGALMTAFGHYFKSVEEELGKDDLDMFSILFSDENGKTPDLASVLSEFATATMSGFFDATPTSNISKEEIPAEGMSILDLLVFTKIANTRSEARRLVQQGGISANREKVTSIDLSFGEKDFADGVLLQKGKKVYHKVVLAGIEKI